MSCTHTLTYTWSFLCFPCEAWTATPSNLGMASSWRQDRPQPAMGWRIEGATSRKYSDSGKMRLCGCCFAQCHMPVVATQTYVLANKKIMATLGRTLRITMDHPRHPETCLFVGCSTLAASVKSHETLWNVCSSARFIAVSTEWSFEADGTALRNNFPKRLGGWKAKVIAICHHRSTALAIWPNFNRSCWKECSFNCFFSVKWPCSFTKRIAKCWELPPSDFQEPPYHLFLQLSFPTTIPFAAG